MEGAGAKWSRMLTRGCWWRRDSEWRQAALCGGGSVVQGMARKACTPFPSIRVAGVMKPGRTSVRTESGIWMTRGAGKEMPLGPSVVV